MYFTLSWNAQTKQVRTEKRLVDQTEKFARDSQTGDRCLVDPTGRFMTLELYEGIVTLIPIIQKKKKSSDPEPGSVDEPIIMRIEEMFVRASTFFEPRLRTKNEKPRLALLYEDAQKRVRLKVRYLDYMEALPGSDHARADLKAGEKGQEEGPQEDLELGASHLIPVPFPTGVQTESQPSDH